jgi:hypothetical protein
MKRLSVVCAIVGASGLLAVSACTTRTAAAPASLATPSAVTVGSTLVDCGQGQRPLLQQANDRTQVLCVAADATSGIPVLPDGLQPIRVGAQVPAAVHESPAPARNASYEKSAPRTMTRRAAGRTWKKSAIIIGGSTAAGAGVGAVMGGGSGAKKGAVVGLLGGVVYDIATRDR